MTNEHKNQWLQLFYERYGWLNDEVLKQIELRWGTPQLLPYLRSMIEQSRLLTCDLKSFMYKIERGK